MCSTAHIGSSAKLLRASQLVQSPFLEAHPRRQFASSQIRTTIDQTLRCNRGIPIHLSVKRLRRFFIAIPSETQPDVLFTPRDCYVCESLRDVLSVPLIKRLRHLAPARGHPDVVTSRR